MDILELFESHSSGLKKYARALSREESLVDDLVQDTFVKAMTNIELLSRLTEPKAKSWLFSTLKNGFLDIVRRRKFEQKLEEIDEPTAIEDIGDKIINAGMIAELPNPMREIIVKKFWLNMNASQISEEMGISPGTVRYHLHHGIKELRRKWDISEETDSTPLS